MFPAVDGEVLVTKKESKYFLDRSVAQSSLGCFVRTVILRYFRYKRGFRAVNSFHHKHCATKLVLWRIRSGGTSEGTVSE